MTYTFDLVTYTEARFEEVEDPDFTGLGERGRAVALTIPRKLLCWWRWLVSWSVK